MSDRSLWRNFLLPLVPAYRAGLAFREICLRTGREPVRRLAWPVVSVGNLSTGGTGKTPLVIALARALMRRGVYADVLSRGYGRRSDLALLVDPGGTAEEFGDEPLLVAREAGVPVYVAAERHEAGLLAEAAISGQLPVQAPAAPRWDLKDSGEPRRTSIFLSPTEWAAMVTEARAKAGAAKQDARKPLPALQQNPAPGEAAEKESVAEARLRLHLLDDGFQHRQLARDVDIVLVNRQDWGDILLPAGNLREPVEALRRAHVIAIPAEEPPLETSLRNFGWMGPVWRLRRRIEAPEVSGPVMAFCGIARPQQFFDGLQAAGIQIASRIAFGDHHRFLRHDIDCLLDAAASVNAAAFVTTEKDRARLGALAEALAASIPLQTAKLRMEIENESAAVDWLMERVEARGPKA